MIRFIDLCAGIGGFRLGLEMAGGFECVAYSEIDPYACKVYEKHWTDTPNLGDLTTLERHEIPDCEMFTAGFPCQSFQRGGETAGCGR